MSQPKKCELRPKGKKPFNQGVIGTDIRKSGCSWRMLLGVARAAMGKIVRALSLSSQWNGGLYLGRAVEMGRDFRRD